MEKHCLNCVWFNKEKKHCDYEFGTSRYKPDFLELCTTAIRDDTKIKRYERTEYCKKFFENKELEQ